MLNHSQIRGIEACHSMRKEAILYGEEAVIADVAPCARRQRAEGEEIVAGVEA